jgi:uncharacterized membrane protein YdfJ with MMPL/SSD domain
VIRIDQSPGNTQAFVPQIHVASDGTIGLLYYDLENATAAQPGLTDAFLAHCHLFGQSMDYQVFLLSRVREEIDAGKSARRAVIDGLAGTGKVIASAAAIMVAVFASFILNGDPTVKEFGVGLASAILIAGAMVCILLPAVMLLMGKRTWWLPRWLNRMLPDISIEGEPEEAPVVAEREPQLV